MRSLSLRVKFAFFATFLAGIAIGVLFKPLWKFALMTSYETSYGKVTYLCDQAMRTHFIAKQKLAFAPSEAGVQSLQAAEIGLIDCQDYDIMRKRLITYGLEENDLAAISLIAIEAQGDALGKVVETHEIRY
jgi:hypothetical protein